MASKHYHIKFNFDHDKEIIDRIDSKENKNNYIRGLILSDIAADVLRSSIKLDGDQDQDQDQDQDPDQAQDQDRYIDTDIVYQERCNWFNEHCPAVGDPDYDCIGCQYFKHHKDDPYSDSGYCDAQSYFEKDMESIREYFKAGGSLRDYPAEFKGLKKGSTDPDLQSSEDYMVNFRKISKTHLNSLYGKMVRDPFKDDVIDNMTEDNFDG